MFELGVSSVLRIIIISVLLLLSSVGFSDPVNINTASVEELAENLNGVGPKKALAIVEYRKAHGPFFKPEEITKVKGIGPKTLEKNQKDILVRD